MIQKKMFLMSVVFRIILKMINQIRQSSLDKM
nr:MAG TPA: hypothetical protein [Bacteriophage sp.]DAH37804.1 MAG TPA: hypothetical protein [Caudoviricetes sp.]